MFLDCLLYFGCFYLIMYWHICHATTCKFINYHIQEYYEVHIYFSKLLCYCGNLNTNIKFLYIHIPNSTHFFIWYTCTVDVKIMCRFSHRRTIVQRCSRSYKTAIERHSVKHTAGIVRPYHFIKIVCNSYRPFYRYG